MGVWRVSRSEQVASETAVFNQRGHLRFAWCWAGIRAPVPTCCPEPAASLCCRWTRRRTTFTVQKAWHSLLPVGGKANWEVCIKAVMSSIYMYWLEVGPPFLIYHHQQLWKFPHVDWHGSFSRSSSPLLPFSPFPSWTGALIHQLEWPGNYSSSSTSCHNCQTAGVKNSILHFRFFTLPLHNHIWRIINLG